ncbi:MAG: SIS domain-containing protein [Proteobacteria bacterium]|nr:SIS domain-containing protein [Pseudomonadota bacterium]
MVREQSERYFSELKEVLDALDLDAVERVVDIFLEARKNGKQIFVMGNGGSGSTASHLACDINKGVGGSLPERFKVICLNDNMPTVLAYANDMSYEDIFVEQLKNYLLEGDVVIGISGSGNSGNVLKAVDYANRCGAVTIGFSGYDGGELAKVSTVSLNAGVACMQKAEDIHLIVTHLIMQILESRLADKSADS